MGDEENRDALPLQTIEDLEEALHLLPGNGRRRLVHDEHAGIDGQRLGNLDRLSFGDAQHLDRKTHVERQIQDGEELARSRLHGRPVDPSGPQWLPSDEHVLRDRQIGEEDRVLVNDRDAAPLRIERAVDGGLGTVDEDPAFVRGKHAGQNLDERALARSVLAREGVDTARSEGESDIGQHLHGPEALRDAAKLDDRRPRSHP